MKTNKNQTSLTSKKIVITVSSSEYEVFCEHKKKNVKTGQFLAYRALEKAGLLKKVKD